ncbi:hypothetical protein QR680_015080 [Steinernema hermaphroditum]|uniref:Uncharacterized protein n=1 Tax=Steinernema hermaphroditum TaxID=289476 RepID=A0AA39M5C9_9BILA|nr:hypothetical protein QR680_015080 [Steinernema hermaphroditum]
MTLGSTVFVIISIIYCVDCQQRRPNFPPLPLQNRPAAIHLGIDEFIAKGLIRPMLMMMNAVFKNFAGGDEDAKPKNRTDVEEVQEILALAGENVTFTLDANGTDIVANNETTRTRNNRVHSVRLF